MIFGIVDRIIKMDRLLPVAVEQCGRGTSKEVPDGGAMLRISA
jgi:hypothetical protein